jgi:DtxR family Mn-dependent transcriptional regulator
MNPSFMRRQIVKHQGQIGESIEMYLKTIAELAMKREPVPVTSIADRLGISTVSASEMVHRLQDRGMLKHLPYKGVNLTDLGQRRANRIIRRQRLWECFLANQLGLSWERVHGHACRLEHATDMEVVEALAEHLGNPTTCPHGNPIPSTDGDMPKMIGVPLTDLGVGVKGVIVRIRPDDEYDVLCHYLAERGIKPEVAIEIVELAPFDGPISVRIGDRIHALGRVVASHIVIDIDG